LIKEMRSLALNVELTNAAPEERKKRQSQQAPRLLKPPSKRSILT